MSNFSESEERQELRRQVAKLAAKYGRDYFTKKARAGEKTTELMQEIGQAGYLGINIAEEFGGGGGGIGDVAAVCEELAAAGCPLRNSAVYSIASSFPLRFRRVDEDGQQIRPD